MDGFFLSILDNCVVSLLDFDKRELKCLLEQLCRNACYRDAAKSKRKDIATTCGFLDFSRTIALYKQTSESFEGLKISSLLDSAFTGCHTTNDRLHASELVDSDTCRFCGRERETIHHIANSCDSLDCSIPKPACPECGPNFKCLGLVEVPLSQVSRRLSCSNLADTPCAEWYTPLPQRQHFWTDGSVQFPDHFWWVTGGFAIIDQSGSTFDSGQVYHPALSSYSVELFSAARCFAKSSGPVHIHSDCLSLVKQLRHLITYHEIKFSWCHVSWWCWLRDLYLRRKSFFAEPLLASWCPSHQADNMPPERITYQLVHDLGTTVQDILLNKHADEVATRAASTEHPYFCPLVDDLEAIAKWQHWLARVQKKLYTPLAERVTPTPVRDTTGPVFLNEQSPDHEFVATFPCWIWYPDNSKPRWITEFSLPVHFNPPAMISVQNTIAIVDFLSNIQWSLDDGFATSFLELAYHAWEVGVRLENVQPHPSVYSTLIRKAINFCNRRFPDVPGPPRDHKNHVFRER